VVDDGKVETSAFTAGVTALGLSIAAVETQCVALGIAKITGTQSIYDAALVELAGDTLGIASLGVKVANLELDDVAL